MRKWLKPALLAALAVVALLGLNQLMTFPLAFRSGSPREWFGKGPAGPSLRRAYRLTEMTPAASETPGADEMVAALVNSGDAAAGTPYPLSLTAGLDKYWISNRRVLAAPPGSTLRFDLTVPDRARLEFGYAVMPHPKAKKGKTWPPVTFVIEWRDGGGARELFRAVHSVPPRSWWERTGSRERFWHNYVHVALEERKDSFQDRVLDLSALAGRTGSLSLRTLASSPGQDIVPAFWADPQVWVERPDPPPQNLVVFMIEATPARVLEPYGGRPGLTPRLREFAAQSAVFEKFYVVGDSTKLSTLSFFTGRHYRSMGLPDEVYFLAAMVKNRFYRRHLPSLADSFARAGYATAEFGTNHYIMGTREFGLDIGFDRIDILGRRHNSFIDTQLVALQWLRANAAKPFVLYVHYDSPHEHQKPCLEDLLPAMIRGEGGWEYRKYLAQIIRADRDFGALLDALEELGIRDRTAVVVTSDHGKAIDPDRFFSVVLPSGEPWETNFHHGRAMMIDDLAPPLIVDWPIGKAGGMRSRTPVMSIDLFPTFAELMLKDGAGGMAGMEGKSFAAALDPARAAGFLGHPVAYCLASGGEAIVAEGRYHYFRRNEGYARLILPGKKGLTIVPERLYDLQSDPRERHDLCAEQPELLERMRGLLAANRPAEEALPLLFLNYQSGHVRGLLGLRLLNAEDGQVVTFPPTRPPIALRPVDGTTAVVEFETDLTGPTGILLPAAAQWVWLQHGNTVVGSADIRLGTFGLPLLRENPAASVRATIPGRGEIAGWSLAAAELDPRLFDAAVNPVTYARDPGVYFYSMTLSHFLEESFSDKSLSSNVRSLLKQWGYIE